MIKKNVNQQFRYSVGISTSLFGYLSCFRQYFLRPTHKSTHFDTYVIGETYGFKTVFWYFY